MTEKELNGWSTWAKNVADTTFGNNTTDSAEFYGSLYSDSDGVATTPVRRKYTSSSMYVYVKKLYKDNEDYSSIVVNPQAATHSNTIDDHWNYVNNGQANRLLYRGTQYLVTNLAYENMQQYGGLRIDTDNKNGLIYTDTRLRFNFFYDWEAIQIFGVWSPDSVGSYTRI